MWSILGIPGSPGNYYRPLQFLVYLALYEGFGFHAAAFHLFMILLHAVNTLLLYLLVRRLWTPRIALAAGALFAVHPIHTEVVDWVAALPDLMVTTLALLGVLWLARREAAPRGWRIAGHCGLYLAALLTKGDRRDAAAALCGFRIFLPRARLAGTAAQRERSTWRWPPRSAFTWPCGGPRWVAWLPDRRRSSSSAPLEFVLSAVVLAGAVPGRIAVPGESQLLPYLPSHRGRYAGLADLGGGAGCGSRGVWRFRTPLLAYGVFWIAATLAPAFNLTGIGQNVFAERYLYLPSAGFCWIAAWAWDRLAVYRPPVGHGRRLRPFCWAAP